MHIFEKMKNLFDFIDSIDKKYHDIVIIAIPA